MNYPHLCITFPCWPVSSKLGSNWSPGISFPHIIQLSSLQLVGLLSCKKMPMGHVFFFRKTRELSVVVDLSSAARHAIQLPSVSIDTMLLCLFHSGDTDAVVPLTATRYSIGALGLPTTTSWYPWYDDQEVSIIPSHSTLLQSNINRIIEMLWLAYK